MTVNPAPGHTVGHQCVVVDAHEQRVVISGDVVVHAIQLVNPSVAYEYEADQQQAARTRRRVFALARPKPTVLASAHITQPFMSAPGGADAAASRGQPDGEHEGCRAADDVGADVGLSPPGG